MLKVLRDKNIAIVGQRPSLQHRLEIMEARQLTYDLEEVVIVSPRALREYMRQVYLATTCIRDINEMLGRETNNLTNEKEPATLYL